MKPVPQQKSAPSELLDRTPPSDLEAEKQVVGAILVDPARLDDVADVLSPNDFHDAVYGRVVRAALELREKGQPIEPVTIRERLAGSAPDGLLYRLGEAITAVAAPSHIKHHAMIVWRLARRRELIRSCCTTLQAAWDDRREIGEVLAAAEGAINEIRTGPDTELHTMQDAVIEATAEIDEIVSRRRRAGFLVGLEEFDEDIGGVFPGELVIVAARPGQGKTSLALQMAAHIARHHRVYFATIEMGRVELALKQLCSVSGVSSQAIRNGSLSSDDVSAISAAAESVATPNLMLHDDPEVRPADVQRAARRFQADVVFVDYLQIVTPPDTKKSRYEQIGDVSKSLKLMARHLRVPVVACAQVGRQADQAKETRPRLSHLRESGNIENDCDVALLLWRPEGGIAGKRGTRYEGEHWDAEVCVAKNRRGPTKTLRLAWSGHRTLFTTHGQSDSADRFAGDFD